MSVASRIVFGVGLTAALLWSFATLGMLAFAARFYRPCRCGRAHDPMGLTPEEVAEALKTVADRDRGD